MPDVTADANVNLLIGVETVKVVDPLMWRLRLVGP